MQDKKKKVYLLILGCLFIILCLGGVLFFLNKKEFVSPKTIFTTALKRVYEKGKRYWKIKISFSNSKSFIYLSFR